MPNSNWRRRISVRFTAPVAKLLAHTPATPNFLTWFGFLLTCGAAALVSTHHLMWGGIGVLVAGLMACIFLSLWARGLRRAGAA